LPLTFPSHTILHQPSDDLAKIDEMHSKVNYLRVCAMPPDILVPDILLPPIASVDSSANHKSLEARNVKLNAEAVHWESNNVLIAPMYAAHK